MNIWQVLGTWNLGHVQSMGGKLLTWSGDVVERLKEHFEELLKSTNTHCMEKAKDSEQALLIIPSRGR